MKILVTGGAGFIGGNFVHYMVNKYPEDMIVNLDKLTYAGNLETCKPVEDKPNYKFVKGDIADRPFIMDLFEKEKFDVVVNFAAESHVDRSIEDPEIFVKTNVMGTTTLLDACVKYGIQRYHRYRQMKYMVICHWIVQIYSLPKTHRFIQVLHILLQKPVRIYLFWLIIEPMDFQ